MALVERFICDVCGTERKEANHWYVIHIGVDTIGIYRWPTGARSDGAIVHLCGEQCLQKQVAKWANQ